MGPQRLRPVALEYVLVADPGKDDIRQKGSILTTEYGGAGSPYLIIALLILHTTRTSGKASSELRIISRIQSSSLAAHGKGEGGERGTRSNQSPVLGLRDPVSSLLRVLWTGYALHCIALHT